MSTSLFREDVLSARRGELLGSIRLPPPRAGWVFFGFGLLSIMTLLGLLLGGRYTRHEQVDGTLVPSSGVLTITSATSGIVTRVLAQEGSKVQAGQPLLEISGEQDSATMGGTFAAITNQLQFKRERLLVDLSEQKRLIVLQRQDIRSRLSLLNGQIVQLDQQLALQKQRVHGAT